MSRVLLIEDEPSILRGLAEILRFESYEVLTASDGESGFELLRNEAPDLVILDLMLPRMSGYDVCRKARSGASHRRDVSEWIPFERGNQHSRQARLQERLQRGRRVFGVEQRGGNNAEPHERNCSTRLISFLAIASIFFCQAKWTAQ